MKVSQRFILLFSAMAAMGLTVICGCASAGGSGQVGGEKTFRVRYRPEEAKVTQHLEATASETWSVLGAAFQDLGYKGGPSASAAEHLYMTPTLRVTGRLYEGEWNSAYLDCGRTPDGRPAVESYELYFAVLVWVDADKPSGSTVRILVDGWGNDRAHATVDVRCGGTGRLEAGFLQAIQRRLKLSAKSNDGT